MGTIRLEGPMRAKLSAAACNALLNVRRARSYFFAAFITCVPIAAAQAWERPHSDGPNSGFADVETVPAEVPRTIPSIGTFAPGAGPVIAVSGTVYLANQQGQVISLQPDGTRGWTQPITPGFTIVASPVVDSQGAVYVVGSRTVRNTQVDPPLVRHDSALYKFSPDGNLLWRTPFPNHDDGPTTSAPANIWKSGGVEVLMTPVYYPNRVTGGYDGRLVAISRDGAILDDKKFVTMLPSAIPDVDYGGKPRWCVIPGVGLMCELMPDFNPSGDQSGIDPATRLPEDTSIPRPGVAVFTYDSPGTPFILVTDQMQNLVAYTFVNRFNEVFRVSFDRQWYQSPPTVMRDGHTLIAKRDLNGYDTLFFVGPNTQSVPQIAQLQSFAAPTQLADGRVVIVGNDLRMTLLSSAYRVERTVPLPGQSIVSAAASRTHLFVSTAGSFLTYDLNTWEKRAEISWVGGGTFTPAIGPFGHIYGMASNVLFVFPPPVPNQVGPLVANPDGPLVADPSPPAAATPASKHYSGPTTNAGHRLFACQELDGDDCGKSTSKAVALAFCQQLGFTDVTKVDTETRKGKAARLDGQFCTKSKCKVFDEIVCKK
jgi:hypothetical protein